MPNWNEINGPDRQGFWDESVPGFMLLVEKARTEGDAPETWYATTTAEEIAHRQQTRHPSASAAMHECHERAADLFNDLIATRALALTMAYKSLTAATRHKATRDSNIPIRRGA
jgi:hypothetical protein